MQVVDGVQRLSTINDFVTGDPDQGGGFPLVGLEYLSDVKGQRFNDLPAVWKRRIYNTQIVAHVIEPSTPPAVMYDIFRRINTGGTPLRAQEIRHCVSKKRSRAFLMELVETTAFDTATSGKLKITAGWSDRELALRFVAFLVVQAGRVLNRVIVMNPFCSELLDPSMTSARLATTIWLISGAHSNVASL